MYSPTDLHRYVLFKQKYAILDGYKNIKKSRNVLVAMLNYCSSFEC